MKATITDLMLDTGAAKSRSEAHRLLMQNAVFVDEVIMHKHVVIDTATAAELRVGKTRTFQIGQQTINEKI